MLDSGASSDHLGRVNGSAERRWFARFDNNKLHEITGVTGMAKGQSLQEPFLNALRKEKVPVSIYLVNGIKLQGQIESFDQFVLLLRNSVSQMVYKHAISTIVPSRAVRTAPPAEERNQQEIGNF